MAQHLEYTRAPKKRPVGQSSLDQDGEPCSDSDSSSSSDPAKASKTAKKRGGVKRSNERMYGEGLFDGGFADTAYRRIANEFADPDSVLGSTVRTIGNEITNPESDLRRAVENEFTNPESQFRTTALSPDVNSIVTQLQNTDWGRYKTDIENVLDPEKNGLAEEYRKAGSGDPAQFFNYVKENLNKIAQDNKEGLDDAFGPLLEVFGEDRALSALIGEHINSFPQTREDWERVMQDPDTYFDILSVMISVAAVVTTGPAAPATIAASRAALTAARVLTHAAQGKPITNAELASIVVDIVIPARSGAFKDLPKLAQAGGIALKPDVMKVGTAKIAEFAKQVGSNYFPGAALLMTELATDRSGPAAMNALQSAAGASAQPPGQPALPNQALPGEPSAAPAPVDQAGQAGQAPAAPLAADAPPVRQAVPAPSGLSRSVARAAVPPRAVAAAPQAAPQAAPGAIRPLPALEVPDPLFNIPISSRQAARLNRRARGAAAMTTSVVRHEASRRDLGGAVNRAALELEQAEDDADRMAAATNERFQRRQGHMEDEYVRFAFGLG